MTPQPPRPAIAAGAHIINDVSGLNVSDEMIETAAELQVPYILMHARGTSQTMNSLAEYPRGVVTEVVEELTGLRERFLAAGVLPQNLILDPGLGFAKGGMQDWELLAALDELQGLGHRLLIAGSRKRFIANALTAADMALAERLNASGFTATEAGEAERELWQSLLEPRPAQHRAAASAAVTALGAGGGGGERVRGRRSAKPPPPREPTTIMSTSAEKSMSTPAGPPGSVEPDTCVAPRSRATAFASSTTCSAPAFRASSSRTAYPPSKAAAEYEASA